MKSAIAITLTLTIFLLFSAPAAFADDNEKAQKKALEQQANELINEARGLEKSGQLLEARSRYVSSQAFWETKDALNAIKHIDEEIHDRVKDALRQAHKLYDQGQFKAAADALENALKLGESTAVLSYDLALCYQRTGETESSLAYLDQAARAALVEAHERIGHAVADLYGCGYTNRRPAGTPICQQLHAPLCALSGSGGFQARERRPDRG